MEARSLGERAARSATALAGRMCSMVSSIGCALALASALLCSSAWSAAVAAAGIPVVAAASDLQHALSETARAFTERTGGSVKLSFGSSGNLARQIAQGAPFEVFFSADESFVQDLSRRGIAEGEGELYAVGRLAIFAAAGSPVKADAELRDLAAAEAGGRLMKLALANPEHAPYGRAAREVLVHKGLWPRVQTRLVLGENVSQAAQFALTGSAQCALIAYSLVLHESIGKRGSFALIPEQWHKPLRQRMALIKGAGETARAFFAFIQTPPAREIMARYGFVTPQPVR